jgi:hypothetical protein
MRMLLFATNSLRSSLTRIKTASLTGNPKRATRNLKRATGNLPLTTDQTMELNTPKTKESGMAEPKGVVCTNIELPPGVHNFETDDTKGQTPEADPMRRVIYMDGRVVPGSFYVEAVWVLGSVPKSHPEHCHPDHDEILGFVSSNAEDPKDLGAEIDFVLDGKKMTITKTCFIHVPAGVKHGGLCFRRIDRPVFQIAMSRMDAFSSVPPT